MLRRVGSKYPYCVTKTKTRQMKNNLNTSKKVAVFLLVPVYSFGVETNKIRGLKEAKTKRRNNQRENHHPSLYSEGKQSSHTNPVEAGTAENCKPNAIGRSSGAFSVLEDDDGSCKFMGKYKGKAEAAVKFFEQELAIKRVAQLPDQIRCGHLRSAIRSCFPPSLPEREELSLKTSCKLERSWCESCEEQFKEKIDEWKEARFRPVRVDHDHLSRFRDGVRRVVPRNWNRFKYPYIPNGRGTLNNTRRKGGNWNLEGFSEECRVEMVISSGKPRIVTLFSSYNTSVLTPLHLSLFEHIRRKGWLLVGPPTDDRVAGLTGDGEFLSYDYIGATDNIKTEYTRAAIEEMIDLAEDLSDEEARCLRVLGNLRLEGKEGVASKGQPMGSVMSFPLLCVINKVINDLSLVDLLEAKKVTFKEYSSHRCLINGDDLLTREPHIGKEILHPRICYHGGEVGLQVNEEKSGRDARKAEINSTLFNDCEEVRKSNVSALYMKPTVEDVLGFASQACITTGQFRRIVRANSKMLKNQKEKHLERLPNHLIAVCRKDKKIRKALTAVPSDPEREQDVNFFGIAKKPNGYDLTREEEVKIVENHRDTIRDAAINVAKKRQKKRGRRAEHFTHVSFRSLFKKREVVGEETILKVLADHWYGKKWNELVASDDVTVITKLEPLPAYLDNRNRATDFVDAIRSFKLRREKSLSGYPQQDVRGFIPFDVP
jgi:hypothetical protein